MTPDNMPGYTAKLDVGDYTTDNIVDFDAITTGFTWNLSRVNMQERFSDYYHRGDFSPLWGGMDSAIRGTRFFDPRGGEMFKLNLFKMLSRTYQDLIWADTPSIVAPDNQEQVDELTPQVLKVLRRATVYQTIEGRLVTLLTTDMALRAVEPRFHAEVVDPIDDENIMGHVLVYTHPATEALLGAARETVADRVATVIKWSLDGTINTRQQFEFGGFQLGRPLTEPEPANVLGIFVGERGIGYYADIEDSVWAISMRKTMDAKFNNENADQPLLIPDTMFGQTQSAGETPYGAETPRRRTLQERLIAGGRSVVPIPSGYTGTIGFIGQQGDLSDSDRDLKQHIDWVHAASGLSPTIFGIDIGRGESGEARKTAAMRSAQMVREIRTDIQQMAIDIFNAMLGMEDMDITFGWVEDPFFTTTEGVDLTIKLLTAGIITIEMAQKRLGIDPDEARATADTPAPQASDTPPGTTE